MAGIRKRTATSEKPTAYTAEDLSSAVKKVQQSALEKGVKEKDFTRYLNSAAEKNKLKLVKEPKKTQKKKTSKPSSKCNKVLLCYKALLILTLIAVVYYALFLYFPYFSSTVIKHLHVKIYSIVRPIRLVIATFAPLFNFFGVDFINTDCMLENPFLKELDQCPCIHIKLPKEIKLAENEPMLPDAMFKIPSHEIRIVRKAVDTSAVKLEDFMNFKLNHPTHRGPKTCQKTTTNSEAGPQRMVDLYNREMMDEFLVYNKSWAFTWEECPTEERPQTFRSLYPEPEYVSLEILISDVTVYTLSNKWTIFHHSPDSFPDGSLVAMLVVMGEVQISIDTATERCVEMCTTPFGTLINLKAGDVLIFDQMHWLYSAVTWSQYSLTATTAVFHPDTP